MSGIEKIKDKELHRIAVTGIIYDKDGKFLITKRSPNKKAFPGKWTVPGGGLSTDDYVNTPPSTKAGQWYYSVDKTLRREVKEEVNVEIGKLQYLLDLTFIIPDGTPRMVLSFYAPYASGEVKLDEDSIDYKWVTVKEAENYDLIDGISEEIKMVDEILNKS
jgi:8-oxo-dGTP pyrophosphatase MutT (NUDIX family)